MKKFLTKKRTFALAVIAVLAVAGAAVAYWTSSGSGSGSGTASTESGVTITNVSVGSGLYPGGSVTVGFKVHNANSSAVKVGDVVPAATPVTGLATGCSAADFHVTSATLNQEIAAGADATGSVTLSMDDTTANQDACKGSNVTVNLETDNSAL